MKKPPLRSFRVENFKAIVDSGRIQLGWLTVFIGNNGVGKSSFVEGLETFRDVAIEGVDSAFRRWRGFEHVLNKGRPRTLVERDAHRPGFNLPMTFRFDWKNAGEHILGQQRITQGPGGNSLFIEMERLTRRQNDHTQQWTRDDSGDVNLIDGNARKRRGADAKYPKLDDGESILKRFARESLDHWQFLMLDPDGMGQPTPRQLSGGVKLARNGSNVAEYLNEIRADSPATFQGLRETLRYVLPYAVDLQPTPTSELERAFYLKLREQSYEVPGWLLSTGTLRIVALLAALRHPKPPPLLVVEEIENGLDPRTLHLVVEEIRAAITAGTTQVILTTHSPYLLDLLPLDSIVLVERINGEPKFWRPGREKDVREWAKRFGPGRLYTMNRFSRSK